MPEQYDISYLIVIDKSTDEAIAATTVCLYALTMLPSREFDWDRFDFVELSKTEYETHLALKTVKYEEIFKFLRKRGRPELWAL